MAIAVDGAGNVHVTGRSPGLGTNYDYATIKYNASGQEEWVARYNEPGNGYDEARAIAVDASGNVYVTGASFGSGTDLDYATIKYSPSGEAQWVARYNGPADFGDVAYGVALDSSGNVYVTGSSDGLGTNSDYATIKYVQASTPTPTSAPAATATLTPTVTPTATPTSTPRATPTPRLAPTPRTRPTPVPRP